MNFLPTLNGRRYVHHWAKTPFGQRRLEELLDWGYTLDPPPIGGGSREFDATDDRLADDADDAGLDVADVVSMAVQAVFYSDVVDDGIERAIACKRDTTSSGAGWSFFKRATPGGLRFGVGDGTDNVLNTSVASLVAGQWHHGLGYLRAVAAADDYLGNYLDTTQATETNTLVMGTLGNSLLFNIGSRSNATPGNFWDGGIAYVRFWKFAAGTYTQAHIDAIVDQRKRLILPAGWIPGVGTQEGQWPLWDASGLDYSGNGRTLTYTGTTATATEPALMGPGGSPMFKRGITPPVAASTGDNMMRTNRHLQFQRLLT